MFKLTVLSHLLLGAGVVCKSWQLRPDSVVHKMYAPRSQR